MIDTAKVPKQEDLDRITALVKTAIGFDQKRGDEVQVVGMPFAPDDIAGPDTHKWYSLSQPEILHLAETLLFALIGVIVLLTVLRPMVLRITSLQSGGAPEILRATPRQISEDASAMPTPRCWGAASGRRPHGQRRADRGPVARVLHAPARADWWNDIRRRRSPSCAAG